MISHIIADSGRVARLPVKKKTQHVHMYMLGK